VVLHALVGWSVRFGFLVLGIAAAVMVLGSIQLAAAPREIVPDFTPPFVEIQTEALGLSADEVEQLITVPLEADLLHGVAFLDQILSRSIAGLSSIVLVFEPGTDVFEARQVVAERLTQAHALPNVSRPPTMLQPLSSASRVLMVSLASSDLSAIELSVLAKWTVRPRLMSVAGVANVSVWGQRERQLQVLVDPARLRDRRVLLQHVIETAGNALWVSPLTFLDASTPGTGGFIDTPNQRLGVQHVFPISTPEDLAQVPIPPEDTAGRIIRLGDVADIVEDHQPLIGDAIVSDGPGLLLVIEKFPGTDTLAVTRGVEEALRALQPGLGGATVDTTVFRPATFLEEAVANMTLAALIGLALVAGVLLLLLRGWRAALVALVTVPLSLLAAALVLVLSGETVNSVLVAGLVLALAVIIDDAVVGVDAVARRLREPPSEANRGPFPIVIRDAVLGSARPAVPALAILALAAVPLLMLSGQPGVFVPRLLVAYLVAALVSLFVALTVAPALASVLLRPRYAEPPRSMGVRRLGDVHRTLMERLLARHKVVVVGAAIVAAITVGGAGALVIAGPRTEFLPAFHERDVLIRVTAAPGTSQPEMERIVARATAELRTVPGVRSVGAHVGRAVNADEVVAVNAGEVWLGVEPSGSYDATLEAVEEVLAGYPGIEHALDTYTADRIGIVTMRTDADLVVRVYGVDLGVLGDKAREIGRAFERIDGVADVSIQEPAFEPTIQVEVDLARADEFGLRPGDIRRESAALLSGITVGSLFEDQKVFDVVVWGKPELRTSLTSIQELPILTPSGIFVTLGEVADVRIGSAPAVINREGVFRYLDVAARVDGRGLDAVTADLRDRLAEVEFPLEYRAELLEVGRERQDDQVLLIAVILGVIAAVFLVLQAAFGSWRRALLLIIVLPSGLAGAVIAAIASGSVTSIGAVAGILAVAAFATRASIALFDQLQRSEAAAGGSFDEESILRSAADRMPAVVGSASATGLVFLAALALGDQAGLEIVRTLGVVTIAGLFTASLCCLFVIPAAYMLAGPRREPDPAAQLADLPGLGPA
jgi:Cu/Ag efflux pump CusA